LSFFYGKSIATLAKKLKHMKLKLTTLLALITLVFTQCKKETITAAPDERQVFTEKAKQFLKNQMPGADFNLLDWGKAVVYEKEGKYTHIKVPLKGAQSGNDKAVYLHYTNDTFTGNYFSIDKAPNTSGTITTLSLDNIRKCLAVLTPAGKLDNYKIYEYGKLIFDSQNTILRSGPAYYNYVERIHVQGQTYIWASMLGTGQQGWIDPAQSNYTNLDYLSADPSVSNPTGGISEILEMEIDDSGSKPGVDIKKLFKCFDNVPELPAPTYSITLCADVPFNSRPDVAYTLNGNPGHTFLIITKTSGNISVTQAFGFYPLDGKNSITTLAPVTSKIVDDKEHEINASITIPNLDPFYFRQIRANAEDLLSQKPYDILNYNCSNFALDLFNLARSPGNKVEVAPFLAVVFSGTPQITLPVDKSPQELFKTLKTMKGSNTSDAANIRIEQNHNYEAPVTNGECN
jgi:hypothetical protein